MRHTFFFLLLTIIFFDLNAQEPPVPLAKTPKYVMDDFMDQRFGMFIHWGPVTLRGKEIGWARTVEIPTLEYDNLYTQFNPTSFSADAWVKTAKDAGMKYLTITAKHHDGFCLWPTKFSAYNIMNSPYKKDILRELSSACKKYGIKFCVYFTVLDWHDPNYPIHRGIEGVDKNANMKKFVATMKNQLEEIITQYNPYMLWFDGNWDAGIWTPEYASEVYNHIKKLNPNVIVNNRLKSMLPGTDAGKDHAVLSAASIGDYATPEQRIGELNMKDPWEACMTIAEHWSWHPNESMKPLKQCLQTLVKTAGGNGNLLFNIGPRSDGLMEPKQVERLKEMGRWLKIYGESIYGTKGGPYKPNDTYAATRKGKKLFIHVFERKTAMLALPALRGIKVKSAKFLNGSKIAFKQEENGDISLQLPKQMPNSDVSVIVLALDKDAENIPVI